MKELTIEQKAQRYDEALERAKELLEIGVKDARDKRVVLSFFPELKESEGERIREWLIGLVEEVRKENPTNAEHNGMCSEAIAWLEKQGEQKPIDKIQLGKKYKCIASPRYSTFVKGLIYKPEDKFLCSLMNFCSDCFEPIKDSVQKPAGKIEPKFHKGDWVVTNYGKVNQVVSVDKDGDGYTLDDGVYFSGSWCDMYHLWTIQDAKDGDIISYDNEWTCIFKHIHGIWYSSYCFITADKEFHAGYEQHAVDAKLNGNAHPATKEQRALLFQKMKEAGYEWDAKKKELKRIEQPSTWSEEDEKMLSDINNCIKNLPIFYEYININNENKTTEQFICGAINWLKSLKDRVQPHPEQEWGKEGEDMLSDIIDDYETRGYNTNSEIAKNDCYEKAKFLKSLKDRAVQPKNQEWSAEDKRNLLDIKCIIDEVWHNQYVRETTDHSCEELELLWHWLDNIWQRVGYPQSQWQPSDEELVQAKKDAYNDVLDKIEYDSENPTFDDGWSAAIWYLKKRNAQFNNTWRPSDEQMKGIECTIKTLKYQLNAGDNRLDSLYSDLKKLRGE